MKKSILAILIAAALLTCGVAALAGGGVSKKVSMTLSDTETRKSVGRVTVVREDVSIAEAMKDPTFSAACLQDRTE